MPRSSAFFLAPSSMARRIIALCSKIRKKHGDGPFLFVHTQTPKTFSKEEIGIAASQGFDAPPLAPASLIRLPWVAPDKTYKLALFKTQPLDRLFDRHDNLSVVMVEVSSNQFFIFSNLICISFW